MLSLLYRQILKVQYPEFSPPPRLHLSFLQFTVLTISSDLYKSRISSLYGALNCYLKSTFLGPNIFMSTLLSTVATYVPASKEKTTFYNRLKQLVKLVLYKLIFSVLRS